VLSKKIFFKDDTFIINEHVYEPAEDTFLIAEKMKINKNDKVLDMGTGCGILSVIAAKIAAKIIAVDINPYAIESAKKNAEMNSIIGEIDFRKGDLFKPIKENERFNLILFNSPYLPSEPDEEKSWISKAWSGGKDGRQIIDRFIKDAPNYLLPKGRILLVQSSLSNIKKTLETLKNLDFRTKVIADIKVPFEKIVLIEAKR
jgi:release factor glutamine methyltransferase